MKIAVTGGTGFVGSHTVAELLRQGHDVKLLVRSPDRVRPALEPLGVGDVETAVGDVTDARSVESFLTGCDSVIHAASVYSIDAISERRVATTNVAGTETVLGTAQRLRLDPIVYVSSIVAFMGSKSALVGADTEPTSPRTAYSSSKAAAEKVARRYQAAGAPVVTTYPAMVWGPHDPHLGVTCVMLKHILSNYLTLMPIGRAPMSDVRDVARLHAAVMKPGQGPRRFMCLIREHSIRHLYRELSAITGRRLPLLTVPGFVLLPSLTPLYLVEKVLRFRSPWNYQGAFTLAKSPRYDDSRTRSEFGLEPVPAAKTMTDTIRWMVDAGHLKRRLAGRLM